VQVGTQFQPWLSAPAVSADGNRIAYFEITNVVFDPMCDSTSSMIGTPTHINQGRITLQQAVLRVRRINSTSAPDDAELVVNFQGRTLDVTRHPNNLEGVIVQNIHPYLFRYELYNSPVFRGSWAPDGNRVVFSDGLQLRIWTVGQATSTVIPNTADGVLPAWSPDGTQIAFTRLVRGPEIKYSYVCWINVPFVGKQPTYAFERTLYGSPDTRAAGQLFLIKPDGSGAIQRGNGDAPAWSPDSRFVVVHRSTGLVKVDVASGAATDIPNTSNGFEPAISRDGKWIAYSRLFAPGNQDIWVASF
jgi:dipeptidyl aminopeptidase/acylaminoacyl peptidase